MTRDRFFWIFTSLGDEYGLQQRLDRLARRGWVWQPTGDGLHFFGRFTPTERPELRYLVETAPLLRDANQLYRQAAHRTAMGWEPMGTVNGLDVYRSAPCRSVQEPQRNGKPVRGACLRSVLLVLVGMVFCQLWPLLGSEWYLTDLGALLYLSRWLMIPIGTVWTLWRILRLLRTAHSPAPGPVVLLRGVLAALYRLWLLLLVLALVFTLLPAPWAAGLLGITLLAWFTAGLEPHPTEEGLHWSPRGSPTALLLTFGAVLLLSIALQRLGVTNRVSDYRAAGLLPTAERFVQPEEVKPDAGPVRSSEYRRSGSLLVTKEQFLITTDSLRLDSQRYHVRIPILRERILSRWKAQTDEHTLSTGKGSELMRLHSSAALDEALLSRMEERLNS